MDHRLAKADYRSDIQGLRAIAVLLVVIYHSGVGFLSGGYIGVDVFFVISGYLITGILIREIKHSNTLDLPAFYARRIRRLLPAATVVFVTTIILAWCLYSPLEFNQFSPSAIFSAIYLSNIWFAHVATDYLAEDASINPLLHTWSLSVEEQFYCIWPALLLITLRIGSPANLQSRLTIVIVFLCLISFIAAVALTQYNQPWAFFSLPTRVWEFGLGGLIALWSPKHSDYQAWSRNLSRIIGLVLIVSAGVIFDERTPFPGFLAFIPAAGAALIIAAGHNRKLSDRKSFSTPKIAEFFGDISYSLYLWHWPVFVFMDRVLDDVSYIDRISGLVVSVLLAWITYRWVENPFRLSGFRLNHLISGKARRSILFGAGLSLSSVALALTMQYVSALNIKQGQQDRYLAASKDIPDIYANRCHADFMETESQNCFFGEMNSDFTLVLFGDSHAAQWFPALERLARKNGWRLVSLTKSGCPAILFEPYNEDLGRQYVECTAWRENAFARIERLRPQLTVIANYSGYLLKVKDDQQQSFIDRWAEGLQEMLSRLSLSSQQVLLLQDTPRPPFNIPGCLSRADSRLQNAMNDCAFSMTHTETELIYRVETGVLSGLEDIASLSMNDVICPHARCFPMNTEIVFYRDDNHITASFSRYLAGELNRRIQDALK